MIDKTINRSQHVGDEMPEKKEEEAPIELDVSEWCDFVVNAPLYEPRTFQLNADSINMIEHASPQGVVVHCLKCGMDRPFGLTDCAGKSGDRNTIKMQHTTNPTRHLFPFAQITYKCTAPDCVELFSLSLKQEFLATPTSALETVTVRLTKVGQWPSIADLVGRYKYAGILDEKYVKELNTGVGLHAHGVGIGAFAYLRRVFERIVREAHSQHVKDHGEIEGFEDKRAMEKVKALKAYLPEEVLAFRKVYPILSKGLHELDEEECNAYFGLVLDVIDIILRAWAEEKERAQKAKDVRSRLDKVHGKLKGS